MLARTSLLLVISLIILVSFAMKVDRYWVPPETVEVSNNAQSKKSDQLITAMRDSGFIVKRVKHFPRTEETAARFPISSYIHPACFGNIHLMPIKSGEDANMIQLHSGADNSPLVFIYGGKSYDHYPSFKYFIEQNWQSVLRILGANARQKDYPMVIASIQTGDCDLRAKIDWRKLWS